jgi:hypothetical protein
MLIKERQIRIKINELVNLNVFRGIKILICLPEPWQEISIACHNPLRCKCVLVNYFCPWRHNRYCVTTKSSLYSSLRRTIAIWYLKVQLYMGLDLTKAPYLELRRGNPLTSYVYFIYLQKSSCLRYYAKSRRIVGSTPDEVIGIFSWHNPSSRTMALGSTQPLTEINTMNLTGGKVRPARKADKPHRHLWADCLGNMRASMSHNPKGLHGLL